MKQGGGWELQAATLGTQKPVAQQSPALSTLPKHGLPGLAWHGSALFCHKIAMQLIWGRAGLFLPSRDIPCVNQLIAVCFAFSGCNSLMRALRELTSKIWFDECYN